MSRYIDAELLKDRIRYHDYITDTDRKPTPDEIKIDDTIKTLLEWVDRCPQADVVPVVHAHWIKLTFDGHVLECSNCKYEIYNEIYYPGHLQKYCSECGARMDEEE